MPVFGEGLLGDGLFGGDGSAPMPPFNRQPPPAVKLFEYIVNSYGLIGFWPMNEQSGGLIVDRSLNRNHGAVDGTVTYSTPLDSTATRCYGIDFGGAGNIDLGDVSSFDFAHTSPFSIFLAVADAATTRPLVSKWDDSTQTGWSLEVNSGAMPRLIISSAASLGIRVGASTPVTSLIVTLGCTYDGSGNTSGMHLYHNGALSDGTASGSIGTAVTNAASVLFGARGGLLQQTGAMGMVAIWDRVVTASEFLAMNNLLEGNP